jgi:hypothetical protein
MVTIPANARQYLSYLPTIAGYIRSGRPPSPFELSMLRMFAGEAYQALRDLSYEQLAAAIRDYGADPQYGGYVQLALSPQGEAWIRDALARIRQA